MIIGGQEISILDSARAVRYFRTGADFVPYLLTTPSPSRLISEVSMKLGDS